MTDRETSTLLGEAADRVPVGPAPVGQLLKAGRRARRRRTAGVSLAVAAGAAVIAGGVVTVVDLPDGQGDAAGSAAALSAEEPREGGPEAADAAPGTGMPPADGGDAASGSQLAPPAQDPTAGRTGPLDSTPASSCAVEYSPAALAKRDFAFAGVVVGIGPAVTTQPRSPGPPEDLVGVTFAVQEWFTGGSGETVTVDLPAPYDPAAGSTTPGPVYGIGSRLLVSGADRWEGAPLEPIAWLCGFTRYFDEETAAAWR
ncbi:hypothetical protein E9549_09660 [Blastococcus sp. MG754426]|uniref:hypothetical protein n=1 Tax=unclassified Blastococcus TaxID=2619396 RepID=UPI001EEFD4CB|nr:MULTISPECIES: hypothetical protein [unclassified Blastococcus]MCF6507670.1 hypothetical protein [Blastococcus sp. MG754426]MCF6511191.1 hypothetical protein [Blastococcus sp. MG754427]